MNDYKFGNFLYELRTAKGLSQAELGAMLGVSNKAVSKWESGVAKPQTDKLLQLATLLEISVEELLSGERKTPVTQTFHSADEDLRKKLFKTKKHTVILGWIILILVGQIIPVTGILVGLQVSDTVGALYALLTILGILITFILWITHRVSYRMQHKQLIQLGIPTDKETPVRTPSENRPLSDEACQISAFEKYWKDAHQVWFVMFLLLFVPIFLTLLLACLSFFPISQVGLLLFFTNIYIPLVILFPIVDLLYAIVSWIRLNRKKKQLITQDAMAWKEEWKRKKEQLKQAYKPIDTVSLAAGCASLLLLFMQLTELMFLIGSLSFTLSVLYFLIRLTPKKF